MGFETPGAYVECKACKEFKELKIFIGTMCDLKKCKPEDVVAMYHKRGHSIFGGKNALAQE